ncbi:MAG: tetratricopeptide repeat protein [Saprospiraceae bacterium]|jgi:hypothetical protein|nr:tetratricopeptide repeat protein [Saprospiraceae bacterium]
MEKQELIERYFDGTLSTEEQADVRRQMAGDPAFRAEVELHGLALAAIRQEATARLRARLAQKGRELDDPVAGETRRRRWWPAATGVLLVAVLLLAWWFWKPAAEAPIPPPPPAPEIQSVPPVQTAPAPARPAEPARPAVADTRRLFAGAFRPYRDDSLDPAVRGTREGDTPPERIERLYWEGDCRALVALFDSLDTRARDDDDLQFRRANCLLDMGRSKEAAKILESVIRNDRSRFVGQAYWYLALAYLHAGDLRETKVLLRRISADSSAARQPEARKLLRAID